MGIDQMGVDKMGVDEMETYSYQGIEFKPC